MPHAPGQLRCCLQVYFEMPQQASSGEAAAGRRRLQQARAKVVGGAVTGSTRDGQPLRTRQLFDRHGRLLRHCSTHRVRTSTLHEHTAAASEGTPFPLAPFPLAQCVGMPRSVAILHCTRCTWYCRRCMGAWAEGNSPVVPIDKPVAPNIE